jgi:serine/threonine-protein phosphatase 5
MRYAWQIVDTAFELLRDEPTLVPVHVAPTKHITVCGDVHGQFYDLLNIFAINGMPSEDNPYVFNGDFVDRGSFSVEVVLTLLAFKAASAPGAMTMIRGNHESQMMNLMYGFHAEAVTKYGDPLALRFRRLFCHLPLAACLNSKVRYNPFLGVPSSRASTVWW